MTKTLPEPWKDVWVTYKKRFGNQSKIMKTECYEQTRRGFYSGESTLGSPHGITVPPKYEHFQSINGSITYAPSGWGGVTVLIDDIIKWKYCNDLIDGRLKTYDR